MRCKEIENRKLLNNIEILKANQKAKEMKLVKDLAFKVKSINELDKHKNYLSEEIKR